MLWEKLLCFRALLGLDFLTPHKFRNDKLWMFPRANVGRTCCDVEHSLFDNHSSSFTK
ncbi:hypothetical protein M758_12G105000 [Ceratodon purpureus]|nr:hypothetical protein M758_12G105000 [Ceratodon purpureus]